METGLPCDYFGNLSTPGEKYYFRMEGACEVRLNPCKVRLKGTSENLVTGKTQISILGGRVPPSSQGTPHPADRKYLHLADRGIPQPGQDGAPPQVGTGWGYLPEI